MSGSQLMVTIRVAGLVLCLGGAGFAEAGILGEKITPYLSLGYSHNSNIYRQPANEVDVDVLEGAVGIRGQLEFGRQSLQFNVEQADRQFDSEDQLDYSPFRGNATLDWAVGRMFNGQLILDYDEVLSDYTQELIPNSNQDVEERTRREASVTFTPSHRLRAVGAIRRTTLEHSQDSRQRLDETQDELEVKLQLRTTSGTFLGGYASWVDGDYSNREYIPGSLIDDGYEQTKYGVAFDWDPSADTFLEVRAGKAERKFDNVGSRDYDAPFWSVDLSWVLTPRLELGAQLLRDIVSIDNAASSVARRDALSARADWRFSRKFTLLLDVSLGEDDFQPIANEPAPKDEYRKGRSRLQYELSNSLVITLGVEVGERSSSFDARDYDYTLLSSAIELRL